MTGPACAGPLGQIEPTIATVDDTAVPDRLSISCHLLAVQIGCSLSAQQVPLCLTLQRVSRPFLRVTFFKASWAGTADSRRRRRQYLFSDPSKHIWIILTQIWTVSVLFYGLC